MTEWEQSEKKVKLLVQIDQVYILIRKILVCLLAVLILSLLWANFVHAASDSNLYSLPIIQITNKIRHNVPFSPTYTPPRYDAFVEGSNSTKIHLPMPLVKNIGNIDFSINNDIVSSVEKNVGTTATAFTFSALHQRKPPYIKNLQYRWDFDGDGQPDTYFSTKKTVSHRFSRVGEYQVRLEVLDNYGHINTAVKSIKIVDNDAPVAKFKVDTSKSVQDSIVRFDTSLSYDNQYPRSTLMYRFDWDGDGNFDTNFEKKYIWNHLFHKSGTYNTIMEVMDSEGLTDRTSMRIEILQNTPPVAILTAKRDKYSKYLFDARDSFDEHTPQKFLQYRWDLNYSGKDDIIFDSNWSYSPQFSAKYLFNDKKAKKIVRVQVRDLQGLVSEAYTTID